MKTCTQCKETKTFTMFSKYARAKDGYQPACKKCMALMYNKSRAKKREHYIAVAKRRYDSNREQINSWKESKGCLVCQERFSFCLELHHLDPSVKEDNPSNLVSKSYKSFLNEAEKCVLLCANCHRKVHGGLISL